MSRQSISSRATSTTAVSTQTQGHATISPFVDRRHWSHHLCIVLVFYLVFWSYLLLSLCNHIIQWMDCYRSRYTRGQGQRQGQGQHKITDSSNIQTTDNKHID